MFNPDLANQEETRLEKAPVARKENRKEKAPLGNVSYKHKVYNFLYNTPPQ